MGFGRAEGRMCRWELGGYGKKRRKKVVTAFGRVWNGWDRNRNERGEGRRNGGEIERKMQGK